MDKKQDEGKICDQVYLSLGSNSGDRLDFIERALQRLESETVAVLAKSAFYETQPWHMDTSDLFLNLCVQVRTSLTPIGLLHLIQSVEQSMGRVRSNANGVYESRTIDIDIIYYGNQVLRTGNLSIPHPLMQERRFVLRPLSEIAPEFTHPENRLSNKELLQGCSDEQEVNIYCAK